MSLLPLFPLPNVVLFPGVLLALHIFEPRYRALAAAVLEGDRQIGMVLLQPGWEADYEGRPPIFPVGCSGVITHAVRLDDGRYNILLQGLDRFQVMSENHDRPYRRAEVQSMPDAALGSEQLAALGEERASLATLLGPAYVDPLPSMPDAQFVHTLAHSLDLEPIEKQALLECENLSVRAHALVELLEIKKLQTSMPSPGHQTH